MQFPLIFFVSLYIKATGTFACLVVWIPDHNDSAVLARLERLEPGLLLGHPGPGELSEAWHSRGK